MAESIASILNQSFEDWELIVLDDGSRDNTVSVARRFADPRIRVFEGGRNRGLPACLNQIVSECNTPLFARMDGDDISYPTRLERQVEYLRAHPDVDLVGGGMMVFRSDGCGLGVRRGAQTHQQICARPLRGISMAHPTWMGRTIWFRHNPYDPCAVGMEDWKLLFQTYKASKFANLPDVVLGYREESLSLAKIFHARRNICRTVIEYARESHAPFSALRCVAGQVAKLTVDAAAIETGLNYRLLRHRAPAPTPEAVLEWQAVFERTQARVAAETGQCAEMVQA